MFEPIPPRITDGIREKAQDLDRFFGAPEVDVRVG
jgi:hypothetical protein